MHAVEMESSKVFILDRSVGWKSVKFRRETAKRKTRVNPHLSIACESKQPDEDL